ncbi:MULTISPECIES: transposase [Streptomyces]|uniref:transposase n=1 Tax=Streptomyces TaxID=1883 RepID=UPI00370FE717
MHLAADSRCRPLAFVLTPGQAGDAPAFTQVMARLRVPRPVGRPRTTPDVVLADKAYSSRAIRAHLRRRGIRAVIPQPSDQAANRKRRGWPARRTTAGLRPRGLQAAEHRRTVHQQDQAVARSGDPLRQDRHRLPRRSSHRRHLHLVSQMTPAAS